MDGVPLSVVIVAHNSLSELRRSLLPLVAQLGPEDEVIIVDNASSDGLASALPALAPRARLIPMDDNAGFAAGANRGAREARTDLIVLLNPDVVVQEGWAAAIRAPWGGRWAAWMGLVLLDGGHAINTSGGVLHFTGFGWAGQMGQDAGMAPRAPAPVGFASGACLAIPRPTWERADGFPESFFMYCEDVDLSLKLRLAGGEVAVVPDARVWHRYEFSRNPGKWRLLERNRWATVVRTYPAPLLLAVLPAMLAAEPAVWALALRGGWARSKALATGDLLRALPRLLRERRALQSERRIGAAAFAAALTPELSSPYFGAIGRHAAVRCGLRGYWRVVLALLR